MELWSEWGMIKPYLPIWCLLISAYLLDFRAVTVMIQYLQSLISQGQVLLGAKSSPDLSKGSLFTSSVYDVPSILGCYSDLIPSYYMRTVYGSGQDFHRVFASDVQEFLLIQQSLLSVYEFLLGALKTSLMIVMMLCGLWLGFGAGTYDFTSMVMCFFVLHMGYVFFFKRRVITLLTTQILDSRCEHRCQHSLWQSLVFHRRCIKQYLRYYWHQRAHSVCGGGAEDGRLSEQRMFALTSRQFTREARLRQDFALFQILAGTACLMFFLMDNFQYFA